MIKKAILNSVLILSGFFAMAQDTLKSKKFSIGAFASPDYSYRILPNNTDDAKTIADSRNTYEIPKFAYTFGVDLLYKLNKRFNISLGLQYSIKGEQTKNRDVTFGASNQGISYISNNAAPTKIYYNDNDAYIDIPLRLDIYLNRKKIAPFITTGLSTNIFLFEKNKSDVTYADGHQTKTSSISTNGGYNIVNLQCQLGAGIDINFKKSNLRIFPVYRMSATRVNSGSVNGYFYSVGLGLNYFFRI